jgi:replicative DNA helicase
MNESYTLEIERSILGYILTDPEHYYLVSPTLTSEHFNSLPAKTCWKKIEKSMANGGIKDRPTFISTIDANDNICDLNMIWAVDLPYPLNNTMNDYSKSEIMNWSKVLHEKYIMKLMLSELGKVQEFIKANDKRSFETLIHSHTKLGALLDKKPTEDFDIDDAIGDTIDSIKESERNLIKTGYTVVDNMSGGLTRKEVSIVAGRPGHGKTTFTLNMIRNMIHDGKKVMILNREMSNVEMLKKLIVLESCKLSYKMVRQGVFENPLKDMKEIEETRKRITKIYSSKKFQMFDNIEDFNGGVMEAKRFKPDVIFDDYIQLIRGFGDLEQRRMQIEKIVNGYKWLAKQLNCAVVCVSQLNRGLETRGSSEKPAIPQLSDLAESGSIEQVAENVFFVFYEHKVNPKKFPRHEIKIVGGKVRYGTGGEVKLGYEGDKVKLYQSTDEWYNMNRKEFDASI